MTNIRQQKAEQLS